MPYGAAFADNSTDSIDIGSAAGIDNISEGALILWGYWPSVSNALRAILSKGTGTWTFFRRSADGTSLRFQLNRATSLLELTSNTGFLAATTWTCVAVKWSIAGNAGTIFKGLLASALANASTQTATGSGAKTDDSASNAHIGKGVSATGCDGMTLALVALFSTLPADADLESWRLRPRGNQSGCVGFWILGNNGSMGTQIDQSGNGNNGTVTGATAASTQIPLAIHGSLVGLSARSRSLVHGGLVRRGR